MGKKHKTLSSCEIFAKMLETRTHDLVAGRNIPDDLILDVGKESGFYFGLEKDYGPGWYVGRPSEWEGNILVVGTSGCGKSYVCGKSTLRTWRDPLVALDIKGELSRNYDGLKRSGLVDRPYLIFDPMKGIGHYDPYALLDKDDPTFVPYVSEITHSIIPMPIDVREPYWIDMARNFLAAVIAHYFSIGFNFSETMLKIQKTSSSDLCKTISGSDCQIARMFLNEITGMKSEQRVSIASEMKLHAMIFATDPFIQQAFSVGEDQYFPDLISWKSFTTYGNTPHIFLRLDQDKLEHWGGVIRLMLTQLVRQLERRPDKDTPLGQHAKPILILLDEFPLLGKMDIISSALSTLRSKKITFSLMIQSIAQLDAVYGADTRKIIVENCPWKMLLNITEPESQKYFSDMIGQVPTLQVSKSKNYIPDTEQWTHGWQFSVVRKPRIYPEYFSTNHDIVLHTPGGCFLTLRHPVSSINNLFRMGR